jgi:probable phosphoglycerate mutase
VSAPIWLARHGETAANAEGRIQGSIDPPLNDTGREQARALAEQVRPLGLEALYASQLKRATETAEIVGAAVGLEPRVDPRFAESRRGRWEGGLIAEIKRDEPEEWARARQAGPDFRFPGGGESLAEHSERVEQALEEVARGPLPALVVCHGGTIRIALAKRHPEGLHSFWQPKVPNGALFEIT